MKKWLIGILIGLLCLPLVVVLLLHVRGRFLLERKAAELKAQGFLTSVAELKAKCKLPEGTPNAADIYLKAFAAYKPLPKEKQNLFSISRKRPKLNENTPYSPEQMAAAKELIEQNQEMFNLLHEGGQIRECAYPLVLLNGSPFSDEINHCISEIKMAFIIAGKYYIQNNEPQKAMNCILDQLRFGDSMACGHTIISYLMQLAVLQSSVSGFSHYLSSFGYPEAESVKLQQAIEESAKKIVFRSAIEGEICVYLDYGRKPSDSIIQVESNILITVLATTGLLEKNIIKVIEYHQKILDAEQMPREKQVQYCQKAEEEITHLGMQYALTLILTPALNKINQIHLRVMAQADCAVTALAVERYRLKEKKLPETVEAMVPGYLPQVYVDPFDGKPLRYQLTEPGYMVYTIGEDGVDDGGRAQDPNDKKATYDYAFRVYR
jgi:hypothetical protein